MNQNNLKSSTVVITGASSGIGKAAVLKFAKEGANVVLASRSEQLLNEISSECEAFGVEALVVPTDVSLKDSVKNLFEETVRRFSKIDIWINNAGVGAIGSFSDTPLEAHEQVIRTNLLGPLYGCYTVLPHFQERKSGIIINVNSTGAFMGNPYTVAYSASKFGLRGLTEALRYELKDFPDIHLCELYAGFVDTPAFAHAANYIGKEIRPAKPLIDPEDMAEALLKLAKKPVATYHVGAQDKLGRLGHFLTPELTGSVVNKAMKRYFEGAEDVPVSDGNLFKPSYDEKPPIQGGYS